MGYKMNGWNGWQSSPVKQKADHPKKEVPPEHKDLEVTADESSRLVTKTDDIEDRIEFLKSDLEETTSIMARGKIIGKINKLKKALKKLKTS
jgi:hypothetical protein